MKQIPASELFEIGRRFVDSRYPEDGEFILYARPARFDENGRVSYWVADRKYLHYTHKPVLQLNTVEHQAVIA